MKSTLFKLHILLIILIAVFSLTACASNPLTVNCPDNNRFYQWFSFDMRENSEIEVLDYVYGTPNCPTISNSEVMRQRGKSNQIDNQFGSIRRAEKLYVKWRIKSTGQEYEDTVDLRGRLPKDMTNNRIHFSVKNSQLYVYLVTSEKRPADMPANGPKKFHAKKTITIYP